jgi:PAS domain S-box-containing protein
MSELADLVVASATDHAIIATDLAGRIRFWSVGASLILGWTEGETMGQAIDLIFTPEDRLAGVPAMEMGSAVSAGRGADQRWHARKDGSVFWASGELLPLRRDNELTGFVKILRDRTGERLAVERLRASEARLALATEAAELGIWDMDVVARTMTCSARAKAIFGFPSDHDPTVDEIRAAIHPEDRARTEEASRRALDPAIRERKPYQYRVVLRGGRIRWILGHGEALFETTPTGERATRYVGTLQDITSRIDLERLVQASESRLALAIAAGKMAVWELDVATNSITSSAELNRLLGFPHDATPSTEELQARYYPGEQQRLNELGQAALARGERFLEAEYRYLWPDGQVRWLLLRAEIVPGADGTPDVRRRRGDGHQRAQGGPGTPVAAHPGAQPPPEEPTRHGAGHREPVTAGRPGCRTGAALDREPPGRPVPGA